MMKKISVLVLFSLSICQRAYTQTNKFDNIWKIGAVKHLEFNGIGVAPSLVSFPSQLGNCIFAGGHSNICDTNGNLVFSTDGFTIFNTSCNVMQNGDSIVYKENHLIGGGANTYSQTSIILPFPNKKYYVFTPTARDSVILNQWDMAVHSFFDELLYHVVDMNANGGLGAVVQKRIRALQNARLNLTNMTACRHGNGKDWWLLKQAKDTNMVHTFLVTNDSIFNMGVQGFAIPKFGNWDIMGQAMFSPDGSKYACCVQGAGASDSAYNLTDTFALGSIAVFDFDRCNGILSNIKEYRTKAAPGPGNPNVLGNPTTGLSFSPNGQFLYVTDYYNIKQLDLWDTDTATQWTHVFGVKTDGYFSTIYPAPDGKLYVGNTGMASSALTVIDSPNVKGMGCHVCFNCLFDAQGAISTASNMPNYHLGAKQPCWPLANEELILNKEEWEVFPNPSNTYFFIKNKNGKKKELYSTIGELLSATYKDEIEVSCYAKGVYYIKCEGQSKKVIIE